MAGHMRFAAASDMEAAQPQPQMGLLAMAKVARVNRELKAKRAARMAVERVRTLNEEQLCTRTPSFLDSEYGELKLEVLKRYVYPTHDLQPNRPSVLLSKEERTSPRSAFPL